MTRERDIALDILRVMACMMVVLMHAPMPSDAAYGPFMMAISYFTSPCIGLFFMVSGALLLPVRIDYVTFIRRRFGKIVIPTVIWTFVYVFVALLKNDTWAELPRIILSMPFSAQGHGVLWFMYTLSGLYLLAPIVSPWLVQATKREVEIVLGLWGVTLCYPLLQNFVGITEGTTGILYYFTGYAGYFLLGYYLKRWPDALPFKWSAIVAAAGPMLLALLKYRNVPFDFYRLFWYESIFVAASAVLLWRVVFRFFPTWGLGLPIVEGSSCYCRASVSVLSRLRLIPMHIMGGVITELSNLSFGIYLMHILIMRSGLWQMECIQGIHPHILQTLLIAILTLVLSTSFCAILSRLPVAWWAVGYRKKYIAVR